MEEGLPDSRSLRQALDLPPEFKFAKEIVLGALLNPNEDAQFILSQWSSRGVNWMEGKVKPQVISQWNKTTEQHMSESYDHKLWGPIVTYRMVLVSADLSWGEVEQLSEQLSDAKQFFQDPSGCRDCRGMLLYSPHFFHMPGEVLWEVLGEDSMVVGGSMTEDGKNRDDKSNKQLDEGSS